MKKIFFLLIFFLISGLSTKAFASTVLTTSGFNNSTHQLNNYSEGVGFFFAIHQISTQFKIDNSGNYHLDYSLDSGASWYSYEASSSSTLSYTPSSAYCTAGSFCNLSTFVLPAYIYYDPTSTNALTLDQSKLTVRIVTSDKSIISYVISSDSVSVDNDPSFIMPLPYINTTGTFAGISNPTTACSSNDVICGFEQWILNAVKFIFIPSGQTLQSDYLSMASLLNTKIPFGYIQAALNTDFSNTASSTAVPDFVIPFNTATIAGMTINLSNVTYHDNGTLYNALQTIRPYLNIGLGIAWIWYLVDLAQRVF